MADPRSPEDIAVEGAPKENDAFKSLLRRRLRLQAMAKPHTVPDKIDFTIEYRKELFRYFLRIPYYLKRNGNPQLGLIKSVMNRRFKISLRNVEAAIDAVQREDEEEKRELAVPRVYERVRGGPNRTKAQIEAHRLAARRKVDN